MIGKWVIKTWISARKSEEKSSPLCQTYRWTVIQNHNLKSRPPYRRLVDHVRHQTPQDDVIKWWNFPRYWWIPRTKASDAELWCFLWSTSCSLWGHCNGKENQQLQIIIGLECKCDVKQVHCFNHYVFIVQTPVFEGNRWYIMRYCGIFECWTKRTHLWN